MLLVLIFKGDKGELCWFDGVVGSFIYCVGYCGVVVGCRDVVCFVGIDVELYDVLFNGVLDVISLLVECVDMFCIMLVVLYCD